MTANSTRLYAVIVLPMLAACSGATSSGGAGPVPASAAQAPRPFEYAVSTGQYRFTANSQTTQSVMGQTQDITQSSSRLTTIALARTAPDTITMSVTVDSMTATGPMGMPVVGLAKVPGSKFTAKLGPNGTFYSATGPGDAENPLAAGMIDEIGRSMPRIKATLAPGVTWTDSLKDHIRQGPLQVDRDIVSHFAVAGDSMVAGEPSWKITRELTVKGSGKGNAQGQDITIESNGTGSSVLFVSKKGVLMSISGQDKSVGTVTMAMNGMQIGLTTATTMSFTKVK